MYLSEYQSKEILSRYGAPIPEGAVARTAAEAQEAAKSLPGARFAVKAQIRAGGRGLAGGIKFAATPSSVREAAEALLNSRLVTEQTGPGGEIVERVYVEAAVDDSHSIYLAFLVNERTGMPQLLGGTDGGVEFEQKARADPSILETLDLPFDGNLEGADLTGFLGRLGLQGQAADSVRKLIAAMVRAAFESDALLIEINPLAITDAQQAVAIDAKIVIDDNALYRHPEFEPFVQQSLQGEQDRIARENEINFVKLQGDIGIVGNGAGLGLATNDIVVDAGGKPANFMDIRTTATSFQIAKGVQILLDDPSVKVILVNVHGGGMTVCDTVAEGICFAYSKAPRKPRIVFRAAGQNADWALTIAKDRRLPFEPADSIKAAAARAVAIAKQGA